MSSTVGSGRHTYEVNEDWARTPEGWNVPMAAVTVDSQDRVYGFNRGEHGVIVFDTDGNYLHDWGETEFSFPHAIYADAHDNIWIVDRNDQQILKYTPEGELLLTIGEKGFRSDTGADPTTGGRAAIRRLRMGASRSICRRASRLRRRGISLSRTGTRTRGCIGSLRRAN